MSDDSEELYEHPEPSYRATIIILLLSWVISAPNHFRSLDHFLAAIAAIFDLSNAEIIQYGFIVAGLFALHEALHYAVSRGYGYKPDGGIKVDRGSILPEITPNITIYGQYVEKQHNLVFLLTPLFVLSPLLLIASYLLPQIHVLKLLFAINTAGSIGDIYNAIKISKYPDEAEFKNISTDDGLKTVVRRS